MGARSLPSFYVHATVTAVDVEDVNVVVWIRPDRAADDSEPLAVSFERFGEHVDPAVVEIAAELEPGDAVDVGYTQIAGGLATINLGRSIVKVDSG